MPGLLPVPVQELLVLWTHPSQLEGIRETEPCACGTVDNGREDRGACLIERHQVPVEQRVQVRGEQEAIVDIQAFGIRVALGPRFGVAGAKEFRHSDAGDRARAASVVHQTVAVDVLADALPDHAFDFGGCNGLRLEFLRDRLCEAVLGCVRQCPGEVRGLLKEQSCGASG